MRIISGATLRNYWGHYPRAERPLREWLSNTEVATWQDPMEVKTYDSSVSILKDGRAVFNIAGNNFRLVVHIAYKFQTVLVKFIRTHSEYDQIDAQTVDQKKWR
jgi:mRNA interferase HigB